VGIEQSVGRVEVVAVVTEPALALSATTRLRQVLQTMRESGTGYVLLCRDGKLAGIFTERDVLLRVLGRGEVLDQPVEQVMTPDPVCVRDSDSVRRAIYHMHKGGFRNLPVIDAERQVVGCLRHKDIVRYMAAHCAAGVLNLPPDPEQVSTSQEGA